MARQFNVNSIPQINVYDRAGSLIGTVNGPDIDAIKSYVAQAKNQRLIDLVPAHNCKSLRSDHLFSVIVNANHSLM